MATLEEAKVTQKPLAGVFREPVESDQTLMSGSTDGQTGSKFGPDENGFRVSDSDTEEVSVQTSLGEQSRTGVLVEGEDCVIGLDSVLDPEKNHVPKIRVSGNSSVSIRGGCDGMVEFNNGNDISLGVEGHGSLESVSHVEKKLGYVNGKGSLDENVENQSRTIVERPGKEDVSGKGEGLEENMEDVNEDSREQVGDTDGEDVGDQDLEYSMGDLVWVKLRSHYWWPGHIYDPSKASEYAAKLKEEDGILVVYFGDSSFSWCSPSELKPFIQNFKEMSMQSNSKSFVNAVQKALEEMGRVVELGMTCSCVPEEKRFGLTGPLAVNDGSRPVLLPEGDKGKLPIPWQEPVEVLASVGYLAEVFSVPCMIELTVLKSLLSAFYRAKGGYSLPVYHEPQHIKGLEDKTEKSIFDTNDLTVLVEIPNQGPIEEYWLSSAVGCGEDVAIVKDKLYQRRKKKSVSELMKEDLALNDRNKKRGTSKDGTGSGKTMSGKKRAKTKGTHKAESFGHSGLRSSSQRKRRMKEDESSESCKAKENESSSVENGGGTTDEEDKESLVIRERTADRDSVENVNSEAKEGTENLSSPRERKKSKYLSPPYTIPSWRERNPSFKRMSEIESEKFAKIARMGERMTKASEQVLGSPPILKCSGETFHKKLSKERGNGSDISRSSSPQTAEQGQKKIIDSMDVNVSVTDMLFLVHSGAVNPLYLWDKRSLDMITGFFYAFRSSIYRNGSYYKMYHKHQHGMKRKSINAEPGQIGKDKNQTVPESPEAKSLHSKNERNELPNSRWRKLKKASRLSGAKTNDKETEKDDSPAASTLHRSSGPKALERQNEMKEQPNSSERKLKKARKLSGAKTNDKATAKAESPAASTLHRSSGPKALETHNEMKERPNSSGRKLKKARKVSGSKTNDKDDEEDASAVALIVSFPPGFALPSREDLIKKFSKFGPLNEKETSVLYNSYCCQVVFTRSSDAEEAWSLSLKNSPFGSAKVNYRLRYPSSASKTQNALASCPLKKTTPVKQITYRQSDDAASQVGFIKRKLQMLTSMLENCDGQISSEMKSSLEGEIRVLLEKVNTID